LDGARRDRQVAGDVLVGPAALGEQDDPGAIAELAVGSRTKDLLQLRPLAQR
jgi:hypothetical protein